MVSDPFAELFQNNETNLEFIKSRLAELQTLSDHESFKQLVEKWRDEFSMHNDDSTLILIEDLSDSTIHADHLDDLAELCSKETCLEVEQKTSNILTETSSAKKLEENQSIKVSPKGTYDITQEEDLSQCICKIERLINPFKTKNLNTRQKDVIKEIKKLITEVRQKITKK